jgi:hypothetical protein
VPLIAQVPIRAADGEQDENRRQSRGDAVDHGVADIVPGVTAFPGEPGRKRRRERERDLVGAVGGVLAEQQEARGHERDQDADCD